MFLWSATFSRADEIVVGYTGPLSGPAAEYGQDILNGVDMAVKEINAAGGITVAGKKYTFRLEKLDDRIDPTQAVNNARRFKSNGAVAIFNGVFSTIAPMMKLNEEKGNEFIMMAYTSTPKATTLGNRLMVNTAVNFMSYVEVFTDWALARGWKKCALVTTLGAYGDEWRHAFRERWIRKGGTITADKPANYYTDRDFSVPLTAALATKPDCMLIGGPSATTALVIQQARSMGFKGGFIMIDQAKQDYIAQILKGVTLMDPLIGTGGVVSVPMSGASAFEKRYKDTYKRMVTWECALNYTGMHALARAIAAAGSTTDIYRIRASFPKGLPLLGDRFPSEVFGIADDGAMHVLAAVQSIANGQLNPTELYAWWPRNQREFDTYQKQTAARQNAFKWLKVSR
jgi:branched-chain amino acid transport system substrate-binding protein